MKKTLKKWSIALSAVVVSSTLLTGCLGQPSIKGVMQKVSKASNELEKGNKSGSMIFEMKGTQKLGGKDQELDLKFENSANPSMTHINGTVKQSGQTITMDMYIADKEMYGKLSPGPDMWFKSNTIPSEFQNMNKLMDFAKKEFDNFPKAFSALEKTKAFSMKEESGNYIITYDSSKADKAQLDESIKQMEKELGTNLGMTFRNSKQTITVDGKTYKITKMDVKQTGTIGGQTIDQDMVVSFKESSSPVTVPEDVKNNAVDPSKLRPGTQGTDNQGQGLGNNGQAPSGNQKQSTGNNAQGSSQKNQDRLINIPENNYEWNFKVD
ncbi:DUF6612 family protein [Thermoactinomyces sp. DSM 45892]|uniref:DUF6612 family protein n=1 Tax=Thermoactinomyces sp. DSM 45892 TaxID=1882753 RepID=UPI000897E77A|nr:DUF6612 family protein [Thermoactinomyces sp. DSM 45892]SDY10423.1 hypothetical protein SAMN05444416_10214 [Thermoactinomyces sp. DSM 45892]